MNTETKPKFISYRQPDYPAMKKSPPEVAVLSTFSPSGGYYSRDNNEIQKVTLYKMLKLVRQTDTRVIYVPYWEEHRKTNEIPFMRDTCTRVGEASRWGYRNVGTQLQVPGKSDQGKDVYDINLDIEAREEWNKTAAAKSKELKAGKELEWATKVSEAWDEELEDLWEDTEGEETVIGIAKRFTRKLDHYGEATFWVAVSAALDKNHSGDGEAPVKWTATITGFYKDTYGRETTPRSWNNTVNATCLEELVYKIMNGKGEDY